MNKKTEAILIISALAYLAYRFLSKVSPLRAVKFGVDHIKLKGLNLEVGVLVMNPTNAALKLKSFVGDVFLNGSPVATAKDFQEQEIRANGQSVVNLLLVPSGFGIVSFITNAINKEGSKGLILKGVANFDQGAVPINISF